MLRLSTSALRGEADIPDAGFNVRYTHSGHWLLNEPSV